MSIGPLNEVLVSITNIVRHSESGTILFSPDDAGEERFDQWQKALLDCAEVIHNTWSENTPTADKALDVFEKLFQIPIIARKETI